MKTKAIMILGLFSLWAVLSCRCDVEEDEPEKRDKTPETQPLRPQHYPENDTLLLSK